MSDAPADGGAIRPALRIVRGYPSAEELAAMVVVVSATEPAADRGATTATAGRWNDPARTLRRGWRAGPGLAIRSAVVTRVVRTCLVLVFAALLTAACGGANDGTSAGTDAGVSGLPRAVKVDYQIGGAYPPLADARVIIRDRRDEPVKGRWNVCYLNAFQTDQDDDAWWRKNHDDLLLRSPQGEYLTDAYWHETLLDISTERKRTALLGIMNERIDQCSQSGFDAIEADNLDSYTRSLNEISKDDVIAYAALLARRAHAQGIQIAQKNAPELASARDDTGFDFAIAEECQVHKECDAYTSVYDGAVIEIEYTDNGRAAFAAACAARGRSISILLRDRQVVPYGTAGYVSQYCDG